MDGASSTDHDHRPIAPRRSRCCGVFPNPAEGRTPTRGSELAAAAISMFGSGQRIHGMGGSAAGRAGSRHRLVAVRGRGSESAPRIHAECRAGQSRTRWRGTAPAPGTRDDESGPDAVSLWRSVQQSTGRAAAENDASATHFPRLVSQHRTEVTCESSIPSPLRCSPCSRPATQAGSPPQRGSALESRSLSQNKNPPWRDTCSRRTGSTAPAPARSSSPMYV